MAVPRRLARKLQQTLGDEAAQDLVTWMDQVDTQRDDLRALIRQVAERQESARADMAELRQEMHLGFAELRQEMQAGFAQVRELIAAETAERKVADAELRADFVESRASLRAEIANVRADLLKWSFVFWVTTLGAVLLTRF